MTLENTHEDVKYGENNVKIERFLSKEITLKSGKKAQACITVKHTISKNGRTLYSIEAMDIKNALEKTRAKGQDHKGDLSNNSSIADKADSVNEIKRASSMLHDKIENDRQALERREAELKEATKRGTDEPRTAKKIELVKSPVGKNAFGEFDSDQLNAMGIKNSTGKIVLPKGDSSFGLEHIKKHEKEVKKFGYKDIEHFVYSMCNTFESIKKASDTNEGNKTFVLLREYDKKHDGTLFLEFQVQERKGKKNVFVVTSGGVFKSKNKKKFEDVWTDHPIQSQSKGETADSDTSVENSPITEANRQTTADNSSIADKADSDKEDLPENASSKLNKGVAEIRKHYESSKSVLGGKKALSLLL